MTLNTLRTLPPRRPERTRNPGRRRPRYRPVRRNEDLVQRRISMQTIDYGTDERLDARRISKDETYKSRQIQASRALTLLPREHLTGLIRKVAELLIDAFRQRLPPKRKLSRIRRAERVVRQQLTCAELLREADIRKGIEIARTALKRALCELHAERVPKIA